jgi:uncharacterized membrane protein YcaP (DUF421 family)
VTLDWHALFVPEMPVEMVLRGTVSFWFLFALFRVAIRRRIGAVGMADILVLVIVSDAIQNSMAGEYRSVTDGFILVATLVGWTVFTDWVAFRVPALRTLMEPPPLLLIRDGRLLRRNMRAELLTETELLSKLRAQGVADPSQVERAFMESDGEISVIRRERAASSS